MRSNCMLLLVVLSLSLTAHAQDDAPKLKVSGESLTAEQTAVYRAVLRDIQKDSKDTLNLAKTTEPLGSLPRFSMAHAPRPPSLKLPKTRPRLSIILTRH
jgi:hypothetical protein